MEGLEILVTNSDLVLKQEERLIKLFVMFKDNKYGTKYVVFTDNNMKELFYGNPLVNGNKMVIMKFKDIKDAEMIKEFVWKFLNNESSSNFEIIQIPEINKLEIIDNNVLEVKEEYINKLCDIFFNKDINDSSNIDNNGNVKVKNKKKKNKLPLLLGMIIVFLGIFAFMYLKKNPDLIYGKNIYVQCSIKNFNDELNANVNEVITLTFNNSQTLKKHEKNIIYKFNDSDIYYNFKEKNLQYKYISETGEEKFSDEELSYEILVNHDLKSNNDFPKGYDELFSYYNNLKYSCNNLEK